MRLSRILTLAVLCIIFHCNKGLTNFLGDASLLTFSAIPAAGTTVGRLTEIDITFSGPVQGADVSTNFTLSGIGAAGLSITGVSFLSGFTYRIGIAGNVQNGPILLTLQGVTDLNGKRLGNNTLSYTGNIVNPTFTASPAAGSSFNALTAFTVTFSSAVSGAGIAGNYTITNAAGGTLAVASVTGPVGNTYTVNLTGAVGNGAISIAIAGVTDPVTGLALAGSPLAYTADTAAPTLTLSSAVTNPTNVSPFTVTFTFNENVTGFALGDITVGNGSAGNFQITSAQVYTADITPAAAGAVTVDVAASAAQDTAGNNSAAATQLSRTYDNVQPTVTLSSSAAANTNTSPIPVTITFSNNVTGFVTGGVTVGNGTAGNFAGGPAVYTIDVTPTAAGAITVDVAAGVAQDGAGNNNTAATQLSRNYDATQPTMTPNPAQNSAVGTIFSSVDVTFSETVNAAAGLTASYVASGAGQGTWSTNPTSVTQNGGGCGTNCYRLAFSGSPTNGSLVITISGVQDTSGNSLSGATVSYVGGWTKRRKLTMNNSAQAQNLSNFPLMVRVDSSRIDYANTQNSGQDIRFYDADGVTMLSHEIEKWDEAGSSYVWVKVPQVDASSNTDYIWMYYGNPTVADGQSATNVWDTNFKTVLHLKSGSFTDSTSAANNATNFGATDVAGKIGDGKQTLAASSQYMRAATTGMSGTTGTAEAWGFPLTSASAGVSQMLISHWDGVSGNKIYLTQRGNSFPNSFVVALGNMSSPFVDTGVTIPTNTVWSHMVLTWNSGTYKAYLNGALVATNTYTNFATLDTNIFFCRNAQGGFFWDGYSDEFRISNAVRSDQWIAAQYASMNDSFLTFGPEL